jgi:hypothetical protein
MTLGDRPFGVAVGTWLIALVTCPPSGRERA